MVFSPPDHKTSCESGEETSTAGGKAEKSDERQSAWDERLVGNAALQA